MSVRLRYRRFMSLADELLADLDDIGDDLGNEENNQVSNKLSI